MLNNPKEVKDSIVEWIRQYFNDNGDGCSAVIGISGGKDSSVVAALCAEALGIDRVLGVMMPNGEQSDIDCSLALVKHLGIKSLTVNIAEAVSALMSAISSNVELQMLSVNACINLPARVRMTTLYAVAQTILNGGRVVNTCNLSEDYIGYSTKYGDAAGDFSPLSNLLVHEVRQIGYELGLPKELVDKVPTDGLCGSTDEDNLGFTYDVLDKYIAGGGCADENIRKRIDHLHYKNIHKLKPMPMYALKSCFRSAQTQKDGVIQC
jgi:NAD+ synthetase